jgi:hypothetical protein
MRRNRVRRSLGVLLLGVGPVVAVAEGQPSPLSPPALTPPESSPATATTAAAGSTEILPAPVRPEVVPLENRPMLVIPGVNAPVRVRTRTSPLPALEPADTRPRLTLPLQGNSGSRPSTRSPTLERAPAPEALMSRPADASQAGISAHPAGSAEPAARRSPGVLGRFLASPFSSGSGAEGRSTISVEPSTDPAAEAALKRRIERQIHDAVGDRVRDVEVLVVGGKVTIRARATRFWQRRTVRRTLEGLPGLSGYHPSVEILE